MPATHCQNGSCRYIWAKTVQNLFRYISLKSKHSRLGFVPAIIVKTIKTLTIIPLKVLGFKSIYLWDQTDCRRNWPEWTERLGRRRLSGCTSGRDESPKGSKFPIFQQGFMNIFQTCFTFIIGGFTIFDFGLMLESFKALKKQFWKK